MLPGEKPLLALANTETLAEQKGLALHVPRHATVQPYQPFVEGPNPALREFIEKHATQYDAATDRYDVGPFDRDLIVDKAAKPKAIYDMHGYWSKKHWAAIREYIRHYLPEKFYPRRTGLVLDCFSGSGMTGVAAMMEDRPCVLIDASPAAAFISHCYTHPVDPSELRLSYEQMTIEPYPAELTRELDAIAGREIANLAKELEWLYETRCDRCEGEAATEYVVYSERFQCPNCAQVVALFDCLEKPVPFPVGGKKAGKTELKNRRLCPNCLATNHGHPHREFVVSTRGKKFGPVPVLVRYTCLDGCKPKSDQRRHDEDRRSRKGKYFQNCDLAKIVAIQNAKIPHWYPKADLWKALPYRLGYKKDFRPDDAREFADLYTTRNLWALAAILSALKRNITREPFLTAITASSLGVSRMVRDSNTATLPGTYYLPATSKEIRVDNTVQGKAKLTANAMENLPDGQVIVSAEDSRSASLGRHTIDYIFTDPAYVDKVQYGELNFVWESWLAFDGFWLENEVVVNPFRNKTVDDWDRDLRVVLARCYEALKPGRWLSLCYHDTDPGTWTRVQNMLLDSGFEIHTVTVLDPKQKSSNQTTAEKVVKSDLVLNCRKPRPGERGENGESETRLVSDRVHDILIETLSTAAGQTRDKLWDTVLKRLLSRGQMAVHRFDDILATVAIRSESGRWFLKEELESLSEGDLKNEEKAGSALTGFTLLRCLGLPASLAAEVVLKVPKLAHERVAEKDIEQYVRQNLIKDAKEAAKFKLGAVLKGTEFYDCLFFYLTRWLKATGQNAPRRNLAEFLDEYLVHFKEGDKWLYRPPDQNEAAALKEARVSGLGRRIRRYVSFLDGDGDYPKEQMPDIKTLLAWLRHCAHFGLADEGVALFEKGGLQMQISRLSEEDQYDADDYYRQCRRRAQRPIDAEAEEPSEQEESAS